MSVITATITDNEENIQVEIATGGGGQTNLSYVANLTDGIVVSSTGSSATIPAATETNAGLFLPTEKIKLTGIQAGAEPNVNADWNATEGDALILNKPTLGTAAAANVGDFATAAQGIRADSALQPGAIGVSVQGYSSVLASTTASFTTDEKTKLGGIAAGAEVNVNADWNAVSGDAQILNKPALGTAAFANVGDFATASQGAKADSALQPENIGVTVQGYSSILANTTASFTTADETKLDGIESGAEVNNISDVNATDLTDGGDTTLHTHDGRYYTETETNNLLSGKEPTINSGTTSQYWRGDKSWQTLDKNAVGLGNVDNTSDVNKPVSSATQTALNLKFDKVGDTLTGTAGAGFIGLPSQSSNPSTPNSGFRLFADSSNRLSWRGQNGFVRTFDGTANTADRSYILPNESGTVALTNDGQVINGVAHFVRSTKPIIRVNGSALVVGDRWSNAATGDDWFWNGTYWLGSRRTWLSSRMGAYNSSTTIFFVSLEQQLPKDIFIEDIKIAEGSVSDASNNWTIQMRYRTNISGSVLNLGSAVNTFTNGDSEQISTVPLNIAIVSGSTPPYQFINFNAVITLTGTLNSFFVFQCSYRPIYV